MAGRPKSTKSTKVENDIIKTRNLEDLENENKELRERMERMEQLLIQLNSKNNEKTEVVTEDIELYDDEGEYAIDIDTRKYIKVMSLTPNMLNLSTEGAGRGKIFTFVKFGQVKDIMYGELAEIIHNQESFTNNGRYYIMNKDVVKRHGLEDIYQKLLTKKIIESILEFDTQKIHTVFKNATKAQQNTIVRILINKIKNGESVDLNKLEVINKIYGKNIKEIAEGNKNEDE